MRKLICKLVDKLVDKLVNKLVDKLVDKLVNKLVDKPVRKLEKWRSGEVATIYYKALMYRSQQLNNFR